MQSNAVNGKCGSGICSLHCSLVRAKERARWTSFGVPPSLVGLVHNSPIKTAYIQFCTGVATQAVHISTIIRARSLYFTPIKLTDTRMHCIFRLRATGHHHFGHNTVKHIELWVLSSSVPESSCQQKETYCCLTTRFGQLSILPLLRCQLSRYCDATVGIGNLGVDNHNVMAQFVIAQTLQLSRLESRLDLLRLNLS